MKNKFKVGDEVQVITNGLFKDWYGVIDEVCLGLSYPYKIRTSDLRVGLFTEAELRLVGNGPDVEGGRKNDSEKPRVELISSIAQIEEAKVLTFGARKYDDHNWRKGIAYTRILGAILRHTLAYLGGESLDPETGLSHIAHVRAEAGFLLEFEKTHPEMDDRYLKGAE